MYHHVLLATDGSEIASRAVTQGLALAKAVGAQVSAVMVTEPYESIVTGTTMGMLSPGNYQEQTEAFASETLKKVNDKAHYIGMTCETFHKSNRWPYEGIIATAEQVGADLIVVGSHGRRGIEGLLLGSQTVKLLTHTKIPTLVIR